MKKYDFIIIGSGAGLKIAQHASNKGFKVALIEKDSLGGTCLNRGCIPSKMFIHPANVLNHLKHIDRINMKLNSLPTVDFESLSHRVNETISSISNQIETSIEKDLQIDLYRTTAKFIDPHKVKAGEQSLRGEKIILALGARPFIPDIKGLPLSPYMTSTEVLKLKQLPKTIAILGASYIACELGHVLGSFGTKTHFIVRSELLRKSDKDIKAVFQKEFSKKHQTHLLKNLSEVKYIDDMFHLTLEDVKTLKKEKLIVDELLVSSGVVPNTDFLDINKAGISLDDKGFIKVDEYLKTNQSHIFALGDCIGKYFFRHSANFEAEYLIDALFNGQKKQIDYPPMPSAVFTDPEVSSIGLTEQECINKKIHYGIKTSTYKDSNQGLARQIEVGLCKLIIDQSSNEIIGAHILGDEASTLIQIISPFMNDKMGLKKLSNMIYVHPALPEIIRSASRS